MERIQKNSLLFVYHQDTSSIRHLYSIIYFHSCFHYCFFSYLKDIYSASILLSLEKQQMKNLREVIIKQNITFQKESNYSNRLLDFFGVGGKPLGFNSLPINSIVAFSYYCITL